MDSGAHRLSEGNDGGDQQLPITITPATTTSSAVVIAWDGLLGPSSLSQENLTRIATVVAGVIQPRLVAAMPQPRPQTSQQNPLSLGSVNATSSSSSSVAVTTNSGKILYV